MLLPIIKEAWRNCKKGKFQSWHECIYFLCVLYIAFLPNSCFSFGVSHWGIFTTKRIQVYHCTHGFVYIWRLELIHRASRDWYISPPNYVLQQYNYAVINFHKLVMSWFMHCISGDSSIAIAERVYEMVKVWMGLYQLISSIFFINACNLKSEAFSVLTLTMS